MLAIVRILYYAHPGGVKLPNGTLRLMEESARVASCLRLDLSFAENDALTQRVVDRSIAQHRRCEEAALGFSNLCRMSHHRTKMADLVPSFIMSALPPNADIRPRN